MSKYDNDVNELWDEWMAETNQVSGDPEEFVDWAMAAKRLVPQPQDVKKNGSPSGHPVLTASQAF
jgi:hypothetical protein